MGHSRLRIPNSPEVESGDSHKSAVCIFHYLSSSSLINPRQPGI